MKKHTLDYLEAHQSKTASKWRDEAEWRRINHTWLRHSQHIAVKLLSYMKKENLTQSAMAERLNCTQQYISKILRGNENMSLEFLTRLEEAMEIQLIIE